MNDLRLPVTLLALGALIFGAVFWQQDLALRREIARETVYVTRASAPPNAARAPQSAMVRP